MPPQGNPLRGPHHLLSTLIEAFRPLSLNYRTQIRALAHQLPRPRSNGLTAAVSYVNMDWQMFVAVKEKTKAVCFKNLGHGAMLGIMCEVTSKLAAARSPFGTRLVAASIRGAERARPAFARPGHPSQPRSGINK